MSIRKTDGRALEQVLSRVSRQYLVGNLKKPQEMDFMRDDNLEIGITQYDRYTTEKPHRHTMTYEYQYMLDGYTEYMDVETGEVSAFSRGDFYLIPTGTGYAQKSSAGTKILFIKVPSINDKETLEETWEISEWYEREI